MPGRCAVGVGHRDPLRRDGSPGTGRGSATGPGGRPERPRFLRLSASLPVAGSNKVLKRVLQRQRWHTDEPVYRWAGRGAPAYHRMSADEKRSLDAEFASHGRRRYL